MTDTYTPSNVEAEKAVLASMLTNIDAIASVATIISADDFYTIKNGWIFTAIMELSERHVAADFVTVCDELQRRRQLEEVGGMAYIMDLINAGGDPFHAEHYARIIENTSVLRKVIRACGQIVQDTYESQDADEVCSKAIQLITDATGRRTDKEALTDTEALAKMLEQAEANAKIKEAGGTISVPFGLTKLDEVTGGMWPGTVIQIGATPKAGKTALTIGIAHHAAKVGYKGCIFSLEMMDTQVAERIASPVSGYEVLQIRVGDILDWDALREAVAEASTGNLFIDDSSSLTVAELVAKTKRLHMRYGLDYIVVDYAQLMSAGKKTENRVQELAYISRSLKALAKELKIAVIAVVQLNRDYKNRSDRKPQATDVEGSSQWEKEAETLILLHREELFDSSANPNEALLIVARSRNGKTGEFTVGWKGKYGRFTDEPEPMTKSEMDEYREQVLLQCKAMPLTWDDWKVHPISLENIGARAKTAYHSSMTAKEKEYAYPLLMSWGRDRIDLEALEGYEKTVVGYDEARRFGIITEIVDTSRRLALLQQAKYELMPALQQKRFALFTGPTGRGKTYMARIVQSMAIREYGLPAVWLNWRQFMRNVRETFSGDGSEAEIWRQSRAPVLILDDPDKLMSEFSTQYLYDALDEAMNLSGTQRSVILVLNNNPKEFADKLDQFGYLGNAVAQRAIRRGNPVWMNFDKMRAWKDESAPF